MRVIDLTRILAGPFATQMLGDLGAEILKVEPPGGGDDIRRMAPFYEGGESHYFLALNRGKKSLVVDLKTARGVEIIKALVAKSDVLVENFRPGVINKLGLGYQELREINPGLVMCSISGFGQTGPLRDTPSFDIVTQAYSGAMSVNGEPGRAPVKLGIPLGDMVGGVFAAPAILAALHERSQTAQGRHIDVSLMDGMLGLLGYLAQIYFVTGSSPQPVGSGHPSIMPYGAYPSADGYLIVACLTDGFWRNFATALGRADLIDDPRFSDPSARTTNRRSLDAIIEPIMRTKSRSQWSAIFDSHDVPHAPMLSVGDALEHPHTQARKMIESVQHPSAGTVRQVARPVKFADAEQPALAPSPLLGADTRRVLAELLELGEDELDALSASGVIDATD